MRNVPPLVSVIIPTYNHAQFICAAVRSALSQTYNNVEVIVIDNFSQDNTLTILSELTDPRLRVYQFDNRGVIAAGRNYGVRQSAGNVLAFLDADDVWLSHKLETQLPYLSDDVSCVGSDFIPFGEMDRCPKLVSFARGEDYRDLRYCDLVLENSLATSTVILRRDDFDSAGRFDETPEFRLIEDWELWLRLTSNRKARILRQPLTEYRVVLNKGRDRRDIASRGLKVLEKHRDLGMLSPGLFLTAAAHRYVYIGTACLKADDFAGVDYFRRGLLHAGTTQARFRALGGIVLFCMPRKIRHLALNRYRLHPIVGGSAIGRGAREFWKNGILRPLGRLQS